MAHSFRSNDTVRLLAGGATMTVIKVLGDRVTCSWGGSLAGETRSAGRRTPNIGTFAASTLVLVGRAAAAAD